MKVTGNLVLVGGIVDHVTQREQRRHSGEDGATPRRVALVRYDQLLFVAADRLVQHAWIVVLVGAREMVLVQLERPIFKYEFSLYNN